MATYTTTHIKSWERFYRANFINSLTGFKSVSLIGTVDEAENPNLAIFSSIVHIGSNPPLIGYINRPMATELQTLSNIEATGVYTINHILPQFVAQAHQTSAKYGAGKSEFEAVGLTPEFKEGTGAPFVQESLVKYALELQEIVPIKLNDTFLVIGKVISVHLEDESILSDDGFLQLDKALSVSSNGADAYYKTELMNRYAYAKPDEEAQII